MRDKLFSTLAVLLLSSVGAAVADDSFTTEWRGTIGPYRIVLSTTVANDRTLTAAHYFYAKTDVDIPLSGTVRGSGVTLVEPGQGTFDLHFRGRLSSDSPRSFSDATGLAGEWRKDGRTLPVRLAIDSGAPGGPQDRRYADVTAQSDAQFEAMVRRFIAAVRDGNRQGAAILVSYPLRVSGSHPILIRSASALLADWDRIFTPKVLAALADAIPHEMFVHDGEAMIGDGEVWFDAHGACAVNPG